MQCLQLDRAHRLTMESETPRPPRFGIGGVREGVPGDSERRRGGGLDPPVLFKHLDPYPLTKTEK